ncbi:MAG: fused MFS/spermidine synthase [Roseburia sp.]|nr:fused MFS/spermidine synthase [Roseburia sp.]
MEKRNILKNKYYLYLTEFFSGMSVMAVELGASRLLAPYFSSSQIVWTIIIGTIMIAMALGNIWGGRRADKDPDPGKLYFRLVIAALWIGAIPLFGKYIILGISGVLVLTVSNNFLIVAAFLACMAIFVFPLFLLGTVTPCLIKYTVDSLDESGKVVGAMEAFQTIGSIIGTFLPTFVTIPAVGTAVTFLIFSGILLTLALVYFISKGKRPILCIVSAILFLLCCIFGHSGKFVFWEKDLAYEGESIYNYLQVKETDRSVILSTNVLFGVQSIRMKEDSLTGMYYDYALLAPTMANVQEGADILVLGMGTGTFAYQCEKYFQGVNIEGVEIDEKITSLAKEYFEMSDSMKVTTYDGRAYLQAVDTKYDVIMVDAYQDITIPFQMSSVEFFTMVKEHLKDGGVMVVNMNMYSSEEGNINDYLADTIATVFPYVYTVDVAGSTNRELFASANPNMLTAMEESLDVLESEELKVMLNKAGEKLIPYEKGEYLLTDDKAPVELLGMQVIDSLIRNEIEYYKETFREGGLKGLLDSM